MRQPGGHPDDIGESIECSDLVEVHVLGRLAVSQRLRPGKPREGVKCGRAYVVAQGGAFEQRAYVPPGARRGRVGDVYVHPGGGESGTSHRLGGQLDRLGGHCGDRLLQHGHGHARADEGAEQHVAGGPGGAVEPADSSPGVRGGHGAYQAGHCSFLGAARRATLAAKTPAP